MVSEREYNGHPILELIPRNMEKREKGFSFGLVKAKSIIENYEQIKAFVEKHTKKDE